MAESCEEFILLDKFRWDCAGHLPGAARRAREHGCFMQHRSESLEKPGDIDVIWWTDPKNAKEEHP